ncbi:MAG: hypothetical protein H7039_10835 [Bryobacteraceae bacterium]|nr:hypothetical protein [Bryobacteraceae bacterium]
MFRGSVLLIGLLTLWWFAMVGPMVYLLKGAAGIFLNIQEAPSSGTWTLNVPLERTAPATPRQPVAQRIHSIDFDLERADAVAFTFSVPVYWAIMLAAPGVMRHLRQLLLGTALISGLQLVLLLLFVQITARNVASQLDGSDDPIGKWIRHLGEYLITNVLPYVLPFVVALSLHVELRRQIFAQSSEIQMLSPSSPGTRSERRRAKRQLR